MKNIVVLVIFFNVWLFADINVLVNKKNKLEEASAKELTKLYLKKSDNIKGNKLTPVDTKENYNEFYDKVIHKKPSQIHAYWMKQIFTGKKRPPRKLNQKELKKELKDNTSIVGYVSKSKGTLDDGKVVYESN